ncbi:hypothetical protein PC116_g14896 [Phytophthora cactorum]|uniref:Uncharacterized protein n=1 Tax=Phytophthora cactorum TaxID=29920 RepID=A0A329RNM8_9STRA|nr:hypothetical protein Pcac1_g7093 [Phytophthora cactorum]KAG2823402.1 hypothetical protein PC111_g10232 [Phytophthora cactorum]KAG3180493.1 hypothetical protein C6341_g6886 [Phytophthora cactorum]KAG4054271.1 hypothetical protein PC123_g10605 [Phytophthora cactorum]KAG4237011.1 hypothetical protein PC116_g14896 [Phytophthora cactorum]
MTLRVVANGDPYRPMDVEMEIAPMAVAIEDFDCFVRPATPIAPYKKTNTITANGTPQIL